MFRKKCGRCRKMCSEVEGRGFIFNRENNIFFRFTLHPTHRRVGRGNLEFSLDFKVDVKNVEI